MNEKKIQITLTLTEEQYKELEKRAGQSSIQQYILAREFPSNDFNTWFPELLKRVESLPANTKFNLKLIMSTDWVGIPRGIKLALGRVFYQNVVAEKIKDVVIEGADSSNVQWYLKK
jgi:hypothetical protein